MNAKLVYTQPSCEEFVGYYNISDEQADGSSVLRTVETVPEYDYPEMWEVIGDVEDWFARVYTVPPRDGPFDPFAEGPILIRDGGGDRTLDIDLDDFGWLTARILRTLQLEVLGRHPLWRIVLVGDVPSNAIVVYPTAIRVGNRPPDVDIEHALKEVAVEIAKRRIETELPKRKQLEDVRSRLPKAIAEIGDGQFYVIGVLGNYLGDDDWLALCLIVRGGRRAIEVEGPQGSGADIISNGSAYGVSSEGEMICLGDASCSVPFALVFWVLPAGFCGRLTIVEVASGARHPYDVG